MIYYLNFNLFIPYFWVFIYLQTVNQNKFWVLPLYTYIYIIIFGWRNQLRMGKIFFFFGGGGGGWKRAGMGDFDPESIVASRHWCPGKTSQRSITLGPPLCLAIFPCPLSQLPFSPLVEPGRVLGPVYSRRIFKEPNL